MKKSEFWAKALFCGKAMYVQIFDRLQNMIDAKALYFNSKESTAKAADDICELIARRDKLTNLKVLSEKLEEVLPPLELKMMQLHYTEGDTMLQISESENVAINTIKFRIRNAIKNTNRYLIESGWYQKLESEFESEKPWLQMLLDASREED